MYLQQQKLVWSVRLYKKVGSAEHIYNSRNQCGLLDRIKETSISSVSTIVEISVVCQTKSQPLKKSSYLQQQKLVWSVRHQATTQDPITHLQQQKLVWSVRPSSFRRTAQARIYNSRNQCGLLDVIERYVKAGTSTIVEISVVCQTKSTNFQAINIYNSRNQCGLLDNFGKTWKILDLQQQKLVWSVRHSIPSTRKPSHLQQQKLVWSVRRRALTS